MRELVDVHTVSFLQLSETTRDGGSCSAVYFMSEVGEPLGLRMEPSQTQAGAVFTSGRRHLEICAWWPCCFQKLTENSRLPSSWFLFCCLRPLRAI